METDVVIIGAGPAGVSAATVAATHGARVHVVDEQAHIGGRLPGQLYPHRDGTWWVGRQVADGLREQAERAQVTFLLETSVWGVFPQWTVQLHSPTREVPKSLTASCVVICTGAAQIPVPIPGWTLPGVLGVGAAQMFVNAYHVKPGNRALVIGLDLLGLTVAHELQLGGVEVVGLVLPGDVCGLDSIPTPLSALKVLGSVSSWAPNRITRWMGTRLRNARGAAVAARLFPRGGVTIGGIPLWIRRAALAINGHHAVESVTLTDLTPNGDRIPGCEHTVTVDTVVLSGGLYPLAEVPAAMGCRMLTMPELGGQVPFYGPGLETTADGVFVAGSVTGIEGAPVAMAQGTLAGLSAARYLGLVDDSEFHHQRQQALNEIDRARFHADIQFMSNIQAGRKAMETAWLQRA